MITIFVYNFGYFVLSCNTDSAFNNSLVFPYFAPIKKVRKVKVKIKLRLFI